MFTLSGLPLSEGRLPVHVLLGNGSQSVPDGRVGSPLEFTTSGNILGVLLEDLGLLSVDSLGEGGDLLTLLEREREPRPLLLGQSVLGSEGDGSVEEGRRSSDDDSVLAQRADGGFGGLLGGLEVGLPDVSARDQTEGEDDLGVLDGGNDRVELVGGSVQVDVESVNGEGLEELDRVTDTSEVGGKGDLGGNRGQSLVNLLELGTESLANVLNEDGLIDLNVLGTGLLQLGKNLLVDLEEAVQSGKGLVSGGGITSGLGKGQKGDRSEEDGSGVDSELLGLLVLGQELVVDKLELDRGGDFRDDKVVVAVEPLLHLHGVKIDTLVLLLTTSAHR